MATILISSKICLTGDKRKIPQSTQSTALFAGPRKLPCRTAEGIDGFLAWHGVLWLVQSIKPHLYNSP